jgi:hypothetical protein
MTTLHLLAAGHHIEWGVKIATPSGATVHEPRACQAEAVEAVRELSEFQLGIASLAMREVVVGDWFGSVDGNSYGMCLMWDDRHVEYQPAPSRDTAEAMIANYVGDATPVLASRWIAAGNWQVVGSDVMF